MIKKLFFASIYFQICGNEMVVIKNREPYAVCNTVTRNCKNLSYLELLVIRQTSKCGSFKKFEVL